MERACEVEPTRRLWATSNSQAGPYDCTRERGHRIDLPFNHGVLALDTSTGGGAAGRRRRFLVTRALACLHVCTYVHTCVDFTGCVVYTCWTMLIARSTALAASWPAGRRLAHLSGSIYRRSHVHRYLRIWVDDGPSAPYTCQAMPGTVIGRSASKIGSQGARRLLDPRGVSAVAWVWSAWAAPLSATMKAIAFIVVDTGAAPGYIFGRCRDMSRFQTPLRFVCPRAGGKSRLLRRASLTRAVAVSDL